MVEAPKFYNYNEYAEFNPSDPSKPIIITHFPNPYPSDATDLDLPKERTRIVRVPRLLTVDYPQFSTIFPGFEEGALNSDYNKTFNPTHQYAGQWYGTDSVSPLTLHLPNEEFYNIVCQVNGFLVQQYQTDSFWIVYSIVDMLSFGLLSSLRLGKKGGDRLERYIIEANERLRKEGKQCRIVSPRLGGYLSLDFVIPTPTH